jgi:dolichyl-phosphate-mannose--protein O-mannosyl transferase
MFKFSVKLTGLFTVAAIGVATIVELWRIIIDRTIPLVLLFY